MEISLVADTNLFFECKILEDLPWGELDGDPIVILLTKPVLDEIDKHKKANGRTRKRALEIYARVREMLTISATELVVRDAAPKVILRRMPNIAPDEAFDGVLDYSKNDDRLVGILATLIKQAPEGKFALLTDDTGPAAVADSLGLPFRLIREGWRRPTEETAEGKKIRDLEKDLAAYRSQEPEICFERCIPADDDGVVRVVSKIAEPIKKAEIEEILDALQLKHPMQTDFRPPEAGLSQPSPKVATVISFEPPSEEDIKNYQSTLYPQWLDACRKILSELHIGRDEIVEEVVLRWSMRNDGTRPAKQVRVQFEAQGSLVMRRIEGVDDEGGDEEDEGDNESKQPDEPSVAQFPSSPKAPTCKRIITPSPVAVTLPRGSSLDLADLGAIKGLDDRFGALRNVMKATENLDSISRILGQHNFGIGGADSLLRSGVFVDRSVKPFDIKRFMPTPHDPEAFYYDWASKSLVKKGALTCDRWRHQNGNEEFEFEVLFLEEGAIRGSVLCTVQAENLTRPETSRVTVVREVESFELLEFARTMVDRSN